MLEDLNDIFENRKCTLTIISKENWSSSSLINSDENKNIIEEKIKKLPDNLQKEIETLGGTAEFYYWDTTLNKIVNINKRKKGDKK